jgi:hypothetical protein
MPVTVEKQIKAKEIRVGDEVVFPGNGYSELVGGTDPKQKYNYVDTDYGNTKIDLDAEVTVYREEPTDEERKAAQRRAVIAWVTESQERASVRLLKTREKLVNNLDMRDASWHGRHWANYAEAQIEYHLWNYVFEVADNHRVDLYDAIILVRDELIKRLLDYGHYLSRNSDQLGSYCTALESETRLKFLRDVGWHVY